MPIIVLDSKSAAGSEVIQVFLHVRGGQIVISPSDIESQLTHRSLLQSPILFLPLLRCNILSNIPITLPDSFPPFAIVVIHSSQLTFRTAPLWDAGGNQTTQRKPMWSYLVQRYSMETGPSTPESSLTKGHPYTSSILHSILHIRYNLQRQINLQTCMFWECWGLFWFVGRGKNYFITMLVLRDPFPGIRNYRCDYKPLH